jgi:REP element-mobilizing transposase RayT
MGNKKYTEHLEPDKYYHIFNRGINGAELFCSKENYRFFILKLKQHILPVAEVYCYCLLPNHFHLLVKIKSEEQILTTINKTNKSTQQIVFQKFSNFFNSYAQAFNKEQDRSGKLFDLPFRRKNIQTEEYLKRTVLYIHNNPKKT